MDNLCSPHMSERRAAQGSELARSAKQVYDGKTRPVKGEFSYVEVMLLLEPVLLFGSDSRSFYTHRKLTVLNKIASRVEMACIFDYCNSIGYSVCALKSLCSHFEIHYHAVLLQSPHINLTHTHTHTHTHTYIYIYIYYLYYVFFWLFAFIGCVSICLYLNCLEICNVMCIC